LGIFSQNFTHLLYVPIYARVQIFIQLPTTLYSGAAMRLGRKAQCSQSCLEWSQHN